MQLPKEVHINDVLLRDGLQLEEKILTVKQKYHLLTGLVKANVARIEFGSFVHPKLVPQMANSGELYEKVKSIVKIPLIALVPNQKGIEIAQQHGVQTVNYVVSASNTHNIQNVRKKTEESLQEIANMSAYCKDNKMNLHVSIATTFGCPFEGEVKEQTIINMIEYLTEHDLFYITLADTTGVANPKQVFQLLTKLTNVFPNVTFNMHFHNTRGLGLANILASLQAGVTHFDAALGGLGGCPFAPGATGNIATEDLVHMLDEIGVQSNVNLDQLLQTSKKLKSYVEHELDSSVFKAGKAGKRYEVKMME